MKPLQRAFAGFWVVWLLAGTGIAVFGLGPWWVRWWLFAFIPVELWAAARDGGGLRDTLSEFMHWLSDWAGPGSKWWQGWNALVTGLAIGISYQAAWAAAYTDEPWGRPIIGGIVGATILFWILYHWLNPRKHY